MAKGPQGFIVLLPQAILEIPQDSYLSWITLFYALPRELVEKRKEYLELPRNASQILNSDTYRKMIESDSFLELVWDCYAWSAWQHFQIPHKDGSYHKIPGDWSNYSGDFPLWRLSYEIIKHFRNKFETEMEWSFQRLFLMDKDDELPWLSYQQFSNLIGNLTEMIVKEQNWQPMIDEAWNARQPEDFNHGQNLQKRDFMRSWDHSRTAKNMSLDELGESGVPLNGDMLYDLPDPRASFETKVLSELQKQQFEDTLSDKDRQILRMQYDGCTLKEIAKKTGFQSPSAVYKHIAHIAAQYDDFVGGEYSRYLDKHSK